MASSESIEFLRVVKAAVDPNGFIDKAALESSWNNLTGEGLEVETEEEVTDEDAVDEAEVASGDDQLDVQGE